MATSVLIFITLVFGYLFLIFTDLCKYRIFAMSGWHVHFYAALAGVIFLLLGLPVFYYLVWPFIAPQEQYVFDSRAAVFLSAWIVFLALVIPAIANRITADTSTDLLNNALRVQGNLIVWSLQVAFSARALVEVTLKNGKSISCAPIPIDPPEFPLTGRIAHDIAVIPIEIDGQRVSLWRGANDEDQTTILERWQEGKVTLTELRESRHLLIVQHSEIASVRRLGRTKIRVREIVLI